MNTIRYDFHNVDAEEILQELSIGYRSRGKNIGEGWLGVCCPWCGDDNYHLGINADRKTISCWKCGITGTIYKFLTEELQDRNKAKEILQRYSSRIFKTYAQDNYTRKKIVQFPKYAKKGLSDYHKIYLKKRRFNPDQLAEKYNLYHVGPVGEFNNRIIVPIIDRYKLMTYTSIDISDESSNRYKHLSKENSVLHAKEILYNSDTSNKNTIYIVEGIFDCWRIGDGCVPTFGVKFTAEQVYLLAQYPRIVIIGDGDKEGYNFNKKLGTELSAFSKVIYYNLDKGIDPDALTKQEVYKIRNS